MYPRERLQKACRLYAVTDNAWLCGRSLASCVKQALVGGATFVQLREKNASTDRLVELAHEIAPLCRKAGVPFVIDDDVEAARRAGADGVHVGQSDTACALAREMLGSDAIVGVSVQTLEQAHAAQAAGADYLGVGTLFGTSTKPEAGLITFETLQAICAGVDIPVVAIGGLNETTVPELAGSGIDGIAVVSAIFAADDIAVATRKLDALLSPVLEA